jgi:adenine C2-methylase RlmN of 23S rRNA A2503 and tRNA A37
MSSRIITAAKQLTVAKTIVSPNNEVRWKNRNWIIDYGKSFLEARYVRRAPNSISTYVSSHNGCTMGCKFCWLTQQKQTSFKHSKVDAYKLQLDKILSGIPEQDNADINKKDIRININFMARGEPLANTSVINNYSNLYSTLDNTVKEHGYGSTKINISTIMPHTVRNRKLIDVFSDMPVNLYYSFYSTSDQFRNKWMPNAIPYQESLDKLAEFQQKRSLIDSPDKLPTITFHWAFIKGENDSHENVIAIADEIKKRNFIKTKFNLVRFNPHPDLKHEEADETKLNELFEVMNNAVTNTSTTNNSRFIPRACNKVYASCGQFINDSDVYKDDL